MKTKRILVACEFSGVVREAFRTLGHNATSCDLLPSDTPGPHHQGDVSELLQESWDLIIAHPPCTFLCNSGVHWLHKDESRWQRLDEAAFFFRQFLEHDCPKIAIENPVPHRYAIDRLGGVSYTQTIQPWQFGHPESKRTCLWLKGLPKLTETNNVKELFDTLPKNQQQRLHYLGPSKNRAKLRSTTFFGIAAAMAEQWGQTLSA